MGQASSNSGWFAEDVEKVNPDLAVPDQEEIPIACAMTK